MTLVLGAFVSKAQNISGTVADAEGSPLFNASVIWLGSTQGAVTDVSGHFELAVPAGKSQLVISSVGYQPDTLEAKPGDELNIQLMPVVLDGVEVTANEVTRPMFSVDNVEKITISGLQTAPCCNLSESFESSATVDVSFADAITGAKEIKMLGLDGYYTQILEENTPAIRGLANTYGMTYIPGPWMDGISINKGAGSVVNGYESITGQINVEYRKPDKSDKLYLNLFGNHHGRFEANADASYQLNEKWSTMLLSHYSQDRTSLDHDDDGFIDMPKARQLNLMNRWKYNSGGKLMGQFGLQYLNENRLGGQVGFNPDNIPENPDLYGFNVDTRRYGFWGKTGFLMGMENSIGITLKTYRHEQDATFGLSDYSGTEHFANLNFIYQSVDMETDNTIKLGASYQFDDFEERFDSTDYNRRESVPGIFAEYTHKWGDKATMLLGLRTDIHNEFGVFVSPRVHLRYAILPTMVLRASGGKGYRVANIFAENLGSLASSRQLVIGENLLPEEAWNFGVNYNYSFYIGFQEASIALDYYRTHFINQVVVDMEDPDLLQFYNLEGKSYSGSFQAEFQYEVLNGLKLKFAYKRDDVKTTYGDELKSVPFISPNKGLFTIDYKDASDKWKFYINAQLHGKKRLPSTEENPEVYQAVAESPAFFLLNAQATVMLGNVEVYVGGENLTNYTQHNPIIAANNPYGEYFDASMVWGPLRGATAYAGLRWKIPYEDSERPKLEMPAMDMEME